MRNRLSICGAVVVLLFVGASVWAQNSEEMNRGWCSPEGTWQGMNFAEGNPFIVTIERAGSGRFTIVAEGLTNPLAVENTGWRGELNRTGPRTFSLRQLAFFRFQDGMLALAATTGEVVLQSCDHFDLDLDLLGLYLWRPGIVPFVDAFDVPYIPPGDPAHAEYDRMPSP